MNATLSGPTAEPALAPVIRTATEPLEISQLRALLGEHHYLGAGRPAGHVLWQGAWERDPESGTDRHVSLNQAFIHYADHRAEALRLITNTAPP